MLLLYTFCLHFLSASAVHYFCSYLLDLDPSLVVLVPLILLLFLAGTIIMPLTKGMQTLFGYIRDMDPAEDLPLTTTLGGFSI